MASTHLSAAGPRGRRRPRSHRESAEAVTPISAASSARETDAFCRINRPCPDPDSCRARARSVTIDSRVAGSRSDRKDLSLILRLTRKKLAVALPINYREAMARRVPTTFQVAFRGQAGEAPVISTRDERITTADVVVRMEIPSGGYVVDAEFVRDQHGDPVLTGLLVRTSSQGKDGTPGRDPVGLSPRDVKRLPLASCIRTTTAHARFALGGLFNVWGWASEEARSEWREQWDAERLEIAMATSDAWVPRSSLPRGRPAKGRSTRWYKDLAKVHEELEAAGTQSPAGEIARRKGVPVNTVYQWVYRARQLGFLPPAPTKKHRT